MDTLCADTVGALPELRWSRGAVLGAQWVFKGVGPGGVPATRRSLPCARCLRAHRRALRDTRGRREPTEPGLRPGLRGNAGRRGGGTRFPTRSQKTLKMGRDAGRGEPGGAARPRGHPGPDPLLACAFLWKLSMATPAGCVLASGERRCLQKRREHVPGEPCLLQPRRLAGCVPPEPWVPPAPPGQAAGRGGDPGSGGRRGRCWRSLTRGVIPSWKR